MAKKKYFNNSLLITMAFIVVMYGGLAAWFHSDGDKSGAKITFGLMVAGLVVCLVGNAIDKKLEKK